MQALAPNANIQKGDIRATTTFGGAERPMKTLPTGHPFDQLGAGVFSHMVKTASPEKRAVFESAGRGTTPVRASAKPHRQPRKAKRGIDK